MRISFRINDKHETELVNYLSVYKKENLSDVIRQILKQYFLDQMSDKTTVKKSDMIKWNFPT